MLSSYWKNRITKEFNSGDKSIEQLVADYGYSEKVIKSVLFPDTKNRGTITDAVVRVAPPVRFPVKKGLTIVAGKDPKWVEAGKKAHVTKLNNLKKQDDPQPEPKREVPKEQPKVVQKQEMSVEDMRQALKKLEQTPTAGLNRKQRRELSKQTQTMRIELGKKTYTEPTPHDIVDAVIANFTGNSAPPDKPKRKYVKKAKQQEEPIPIPDIVVPEPISQMPPNPIEQAKRMKDAVAYMDNIFPVEKKEAKKANVLAAEHMINSAMTLLNEAIKLLKQEE